MIRKVEPIDAGKVAEIYNHYILNTTVTSEETALSEDQMSERINRISASYPYLVHEENGQILGYTYAYEWKSRSAYRLSVEASVYVKDGYTGKGIGTKLYEELIQQLKAMKFHAVIGGIANPNPLSIALHEKFGFRKVAHFKEVAFKFQQWIDVGYWELIL